MKNLIKSLITASVFFNLNISNAQNEQNTNQSSNRQNEKEFTKTILCTSNVEDENGHLIKEVRLTATTKNKNLSGKAYFSFKDIKNISLILDNKAYSYSVTLPSLSTQGTRNQPIVNIFFDNKSYTEWTGGTITYNPTGELKSLDQIINKTIRIGIHRSNQNPSHYDPKFTILMKNPVCNYIN